MVSDDALNELPVENTDLFYPDEQKQAETGFTKSIVEEMLLHVSLGANLTDIANIVRLPTRRVHHWYKSNFCNFAYSVDYHRADNKRRLLKILMETNPKKLSSIASRASQFLLERKYRDEYGKEVKIEVNHAMIDNITKIVFDSAVRYITDPDKLKLFVEDISEQIKLIKPSEGMPEGHKIIT